MSLLEWWQQQHGGGGGYGPWLTWWWHCCQHSTRCSGTWCAANCISLHLPNRKSPSPASSCRKWWCVCCLNVGLQALRLSDHRSILLLDRVLAQYCIVNRDWVGVGMGVQFFSSMVITSLAYQYTWMLPSPGLLGLCRAFFPMMFPLVTVSPVWLSVSTEGGGGGGSWDCSFFFF